MGTPALSEAPWRSTFLSHVRQQDSPVFVLSSLHTADPSSSSPSAARRVTPRARTVVFRGMWAGLPVNPKNPAELNPDVYQTHLPTLTTDARMDKTPELMALSASAGQSGGGGPVEAVFWVAAVQTQWRLRGRAYVIGPDINSERAASVRDALTPYMRGTGAVGPWSWSRELTAHFGNLSPLMRGSFKNPPPGTPLGRKPGQEQGPSLGQKVDDLEDSVARSNFRVVVIVPDEVERLDLSDPENGRRWNYKAKDGTDGAGAWEVTELWP
ncbi:pyridoxamine 5'-phosphate oxidase domain-containing protein [Hirsutella rhossiliensis]